MSKIIYKYNPDTLNYERVYSSVGQRVWTVFKQLTFGIIIGGALFSFADYSFDSPIKKQLKKENKLLLTQYQVLSKQLDQNEQILAELEDRDDNLYRSVFNAEPIPSTIRRPGYGGVDRYEHLLTLNNPELVVSTSAKLDMMTKQLAVLSNSYDELTQMVKTREDRVKCMPSISPLSSKYSKGIGSGFGLRVHPIFGDRRPHTGVDLNALAGTPIQATGGGTVEFAGWQGGYGYTIVIDHGFGYKTLYGHCRELKVRVGQTVSRGAIIATVGSTGTATGAHCHYEVMSKGKHDNPAKYFFMNLTPKEYEKVLFDSENR
ncbi:M23 family metallopeptidase [Candidatus Symbiothrix dinenymphae]|uniref:M23 family metallopeptidase n=1 Tax=Candidatus Symbiothrix dinenymphae TaxID=467085 RepID=UPI000702F10F|nr:M23 family metallopeptidase [Candidatus Symbiothrix dinenymphae]